MNVEFTRSFDKQYSGLPQDLQRQAKETIGFFLGYYASRQYPKGLRIHKVGRFLSLTVKMNYRIFVVPIQGGVKFMFVGNHRDAENYLKK